MVDKFWNACCIRQIRNRELPAEEEFSKHSHLFHFV